MFYYSFTMTEIFPTGFNETLVYSVHIQEPSRVVIHGSQDSPHPLPCLFGTTFAPAAASNRNEIFVEIVYESFWNSEFLSA